MTVALPYTPYAWYNSSVGQLVYVYNYPTFSNTVAISTNNWASYSLHPVDAGGTIEPTGTFTNCFLEEFGTIYNIRQYFSDPDVISVERSYDGIVWTTLYYSFSCRIRIDYCFKVGSTYYIFMKPSGHFIQLLFQTTSSLTSDWNDLSLGEPDYDYTYYVGDIKIYWFSGYFYIFPGYYFPAGVPPGKGKAVHRSADGITWTVVTANFTPLVNSGDRVKSIFAYNGKFYAVIYNSSVGFLKTYSSSDLVTWAYMPTLTERYLVVSNTTFNAYQYAADVCFIAGTKVLHLPLSALGAAAPTSIAL